MSTEHAHACIGPTCGSPAHSDQVWGTNGWISNPLHVQVAQALGWTDLRQNQGLDGKQNWIGVEPHGGLNLVVPRYDTSWCSTGVLLERFNLSVARSVLLNEEKTPSKWVAMAGKVIEHCDSPCEAISRLIVRLSKEGKLPK